MKLLPLALVGSHLAVFGLVYGIARGGPGPAGDAKAATASGKSSGRGSAGGGGDGEALLASFMEQQKPGGSAYEILKGTLPVAADPEAAARDAIRSYAEKPGGEQELAEAAVRTLHWLRAAEDPEVVIEYLWTDEAARKADLLALFSPTAVKDMAKEKGALDSWRWLWKRPFTRDSFGQVALEEMKAGGSFDLFKRLESTMRDSPIFSMQRRLVVTDPSGRRESYYLQAGTATDFKDRQALYDYAMDPLNAEVRDELLRGFARSSGEAGEWVLEQESLDPRTAEMLRKEQKLAAARDMTQDYASRIEAMRKTGNLEGKDDQALVNELVHQDLNKVLNEGRDWRYEFRHGVSSLDEIMTAVRGAMPKVPAEGEEALMVSLYRELVEEDTKKALPLLDSLPEDKRREALFHSTWLSMVNINPNEYLEFFSALPEPVTPEEKDLRTKGWNWKARGFLMRFGDDYVEWVKAMPPGIDKDTAMNSLIWATREQNAAEARKLNDELYPPKDDEAK
jgi:hypothetical protein